MKRITTIVGAIVGGALILGTLRALLRLAIGFGELMLSPFYWEGVRLFTAVGGIIGLIVGIFLSFLKD